MRNLAGAQTPIGAAMQNLGQLYLSQQKSPVELERERVLSRYHTAKADDASASAALKTGELDARKGLAGIFSSMTGPDIDPVAMSQRAAATGAGGGMDPNDLGGLVRLALSQVAGEDVLGRANVGAGGGPSKPDEGFTLPRLDQIAEREMGHDVNLEGMKQAGFDRRNSADNSTRVNIAGMDNAAAMERHTTPKPGEGPVELAQAYYDAAISQGMNESDARTYAIQNAAPRGQGQTLTVGADGSVSFSQGGNADLTTTRKTAEQGQVASVESFNGLMDQTRAIAEADPTLFGTAGRVRSLYQGITGQLEGLGLVASGLGGQPNAAFDDASQRLAEAGVEPAYFDRNLTDIDKMATLLAYSAASAIAKQEGRGLSDQDFKKFRNVVGDPKAWLSTQRSFLSGLDQMQIVVDRELAASRRRLGIPDPTSPTADPASPAAAVPAQGDTPETPSSDFSMMTREQLQQLDPNTMSPEDLAAAARRYNELFGGGRP